MKKLSVYVVLICLALGCSEKHTGGYVDEGTDVTSTFLQKYSGSFTEDEFGERINIAADGAFSIRFVRQVGTKGGELPYPTVCTYFESGKISAVYERNAASRERYMGRASHMIVVDFNSRTLDSSPDAKQETPENCAKLESSKFTDSMYAELVNADTIRLHTSGGGDYRGTGPRTSSTLDENYTRDGVTVRPSEFSEFAAQKYSEAHLTCYLSLISETDGISQATKNPFKWDLRSGELQVDKEIQIKMKFANIEYSATLAIDSMNFSDHFPDEDRDESDNPVRRSIPVVSIRLKTYKMLTHFSGGPFIDEMTLKNSGFNQITEKSEYEFERIKIGPSGPKNEKVERRLSCIIESKVKPDWSEPIPND